LLLDENNEFSYFYNPYGKTVNLLVIDGAQFLSICANHTIASELWQKRAQNRKIEFQSYKTRALIGYMKTITKHPKLLQGKLLQNYSIFGDLKFMRIKI